MALRNQLFRFQELRFRFQKLRPLIPRLSFASVLAVLICTSVLPADAPTTEPITGLAENRPATFLLTNARIVVSPQQTIEKGSVLIRDGHISAVGDQISEFPGVQEIDLSGKTIYAGLIDGYSEVDVPAAKTGARHWNPGVTPERCAADAYEPDNEGNQKLRKVGIVARLLAPDDGQIKGTSVVVDTSDADAPSSEIRRKVALHFSLTTARRRNQYPGSPMGAVALVRQTLYDAQWYRDAWKAYQSSTDGLPRPEKNPALETLAQWLEAKNPIIIDAQNERYALRSQQLVDEFSLSTVILRGSGREYRRLEAIVASENPILVPVDFPKAPDVSTPERVSAATLQQLQHWDLAPENAARLVKAGATIALTTDGLSDPTKFLKALRTVVKRGLDKQDALAALTTNPAKIFGLESYLGTIEVGKLASLVVTDGDLFDSKTKVLETWVAGRRFEIVRPTELDARGQWNLRFTDLTKRPKRAKLKISGKLEKPKAKIEVRKEDFDIKKITVSDAIVSARFSAEGWEQDGVALVSLVVTKSSLSGTPTTGTLLLPDGTRSNVVAVRKELPEGTDGEDDSDEDDSDGADRDDKEDNESNGQKKEKGDDHSDDDDSDEEDSNEDESDEPTSALYEVNFPLGAYGVDKLAKSEDVLLTGGTIWTCDQQGVLENGAVLIVDGKIKAVGRSLEAPEGVRTIDLAGKHLTPGIIDCHSHIATDGGVNEGTQAITAEVRIGDFVDPDDISIYRQLAGGVTTANVLHGSANPIGGQNQVIKMRWGALPEEMKFAKAPGGIKFALGENVKQSNWGEEFRTRYPQSRMGVDEIIMDAFERAKAYDEDWKRWREDETGIPPRIDLELKAIAEIVRGERWIHCHSYRQSEILALMRTCDAYGVTIGSLQHILEGYKLADEMAARGITGSTFSDWWAYKFEVYDAIPFNGALMHEAGVVVSFNSDDAELGRRLNTEAAKAVKYGNVTPEEALKFVTLNPAKQLRIEDYVGSLTVGKDADLAIWSGPPLSSFSRCVQTWVDGRRCFDEQVDKQLRKRDQDRHAALVQRILSTDAEMKRPGEPSRNHQEFWTRVNEYCIHGKKEAEVSK